jgi:hypothetical protein
MQFMVPDANTNCVDSIVCRAQLVPASADHNIVRLQASISSVSLARVPLRSCRTKICG